MNLSDIAIVEVLLFIFKQLGNVKFQKMSICPPQEANGNSEGGGVAKARVLTEEYGATGKLKFLEGGGWGCKPRKPSMGEGGGVRIQYVFFLSLAFPVSFSKFQAHFPATLHRE